MVVTGGPPQTGNSTIDILDRIRSGDEAALTLLVERHWASLVGFLRRRVGSTDAAQDAAQEAFVRLWEQRESWTSGSARALLYRIGANVVADVHRQAETRRRRIEDAGATAIRSPPTPSELLERNEARSRYLAALEDLPPKRREVFELVRHEGLSHREIAEVLDVSPQTVANHMSLALRDLRDALAEFLPTASDVHDQDATRSNDG